tara:strand:- start:119 stop:298 length:180 start_codon:yes stop_codon:yes gene_type:complete
MGKKSRRQRAKDPISSFQSQFLHKRECLHAWTEKVEQRLSQGVSREEVQQELDDWYQNG